MIGDVDIGDEMRVADARANFTELISHVRLLRRIVFLVNRRSPMAAVVPIELGRLARRAGGADKAIAILATHLGIDPADVRDTDL
jgi:hypothetical protein